MSLQSSPLGPLANKVGLAEVLVEERGPAIDLDLVVSSSSQEIVQMSNEEAAVVALCGREERQRIAEVSAEGRLTGP